MIAKYISFSFSIAFISWIVGMIGNAAIKNTVFYKQNLSNLNFINNDKINKLIGLETFKWLVKNTFFKFFNQKIKANNKMEVTSLETLRREMTVSEISHLIAFVFALGFSIVKFATGLYGFGSVMLFVNILMNMYPSLLQQENKRRIDRLIGRFQLLKSK